MNDNRKTSWVDSTTFNAVKYYRINKYKVQTATAATLGNEYTVMLRLGEQYLIRAEARAQQSNIDGAQSDINVIRNRAGLGNTTAATQSTLLSAIAKERKLELFGEYGNRWFDLKRTGTLVARASAHNYRIKEANFVGIDGQLKILRPIPQTALDLNQNKDFPQNPGY